MSVRVFISSTFSDLLEFRQALQNAIRQLGVVDISMEHFGARDARPREECVRIVAHESDVFIGVYAHRYGTVPRDEKKSIVEAEYDAATEAQLPRLIYLVHDDAQWNPGSIDQGRSAAKLRRFKDRL